MPFDWDIEKAQANRAKHGVTFEEAETVFGDFYSITYEDAKHSLEEERSIEIGMSDRNRLLAVVYVERQDGIRIISARPVTNREKQNYETGARN